MPQSSCPQAPTLCCSSPQACGLGPSGGDSCQQLAKEAVGRLNFRAVFWLGWSFPSAAWELVNSMQGLEYLCIEETFLSM